QIAGVTERGFTGVTLHETHDLQIPSSAGARVLGGNRASFALAELVARLKSGIPSSQAQARLDVIGKQIQKAIGPKMSGRNAFLLRDGSQGIGSKKEQFGKPVVLLLLLVAVVLLVACANLAALLLVRSVERTREAGVRIALGASRLALVRQFLAESVLLAAAGGGAGWTFAGVLTRGLLGLLGQQGEGVVRHAAVEGPVFCFPGGGPGGGGLPLGGAAGLRPGTRRSAARRSRRRFRTSRRALAPLPVRHRRPDRFIAGFAVLRRAVRSNTAQS